MSKRADYRNWVPKSMLVGFAAATGAALAGAVGFGCFGKSKAKKVLGAVSGAGALACGVWTAWCAAARKRFSYEAEDSLSNRVIRVISEHVTLPEGGKGLDVGCGSGALTIACAKRNPQGTMLGVDRWGVEYKPYSRKLCESNAAAEGVSNAAFRKGNAVKLDFPDESFDAVTSNYVYHNIPLADRQQLLLETLRVLKKGGVFALHDIMTPARYGDMKAFAEKLRAQGYEKVELIDTSRGLAMSKWEGRLLLLSGSTLLVGRK